MGGVFQETENRQWLAGIGATAAGLPSAPIPAGQLLGEGAMRGDPNGDRWWLAAIPERPANVVQSR
ncbi:MAG: hypothetical protein B7Y47_04820 [Sphingomonas sp. 28-63-12]|nr:MAG: hypothetical protein B7Y47_04820 [Sphingomonas sp. 28-63-12]